MSLYGRLLLSLILIAMVGCAGGPASSILPDPASAPPTSAEAGGTTIVAIAPPGEKCCPPPSLLDFLGITQIGKAVGGLGSRAFNRIRSRLGSVFPGLEARPPLLPITDPANLGETAPPAVKAAAEAKADEDAAPQKIKAMRYLAKIGCGGCYPGVEDAFLSALDDCTEKVRYEAVTAIRKTAGNCCRYCRADACCSPKLQAKLYELGHGVDERGCPKEPSPRVARQARLALCCCGNNLSALATNVSDVPQEGPAEAVQPADEPPVEELPAVVEEPAVEDAAASGKTHDPAWALASGAMDAPTALTGWQNVSYLEGTPGSGTEPVVAIVNGESISQHDFATFFDQRLEELESVENPFALSDHRRQHEIRGRILDELIDRKIAVQYLKQLAGTSVPTAGLDTHARDFDVHVDKILREIIKYDTPVSSQEVVEYYQSNLDVFSMPRQARWEITSLSKASRVSRQQAQQIMAITRDAITGQAVQPSVRIPPQLLKKEVHDWTNRFQIKSDLLAKSVFGMSPGQTSPILEDAQGWHVVRLIELRTPQALQWPVIDTEIRARIVEERFQDQKSRVMDHWRTQSEIQRFIDPAFAVK